MIVILIAATLGAPSPASATPLTVLGAFFTIQPGAGTTLFEQNLFFAAPRFDSSLGTLDSMSLTVVRGGVNASVTVDSESPLGASVFHDYVMAAVFQDVSYFGGTLHSSASPVDLGPTPAVILPADSDGSADFTGSDALTFSGLIAAVTIDETITDPVVLGDFTGAGSVLLTLNLRELAASTIPGIQEVQAQYGEGIGVIGLTYEYTPSGTPIPEPGTLSLVGWSFAAFALRAARRRSWLAPSSCRSRLHE
jgi:hypothetical protein